MSKSVNVNRLHVLHLVCFNSSHFPLLPHHFWRVTGYISIPLHLKSWCGWEKEDGQAHVSEMDLVGQSPYRVMCSPNNESVYFKHHFLNKYFLYIPYWRLPSELCFCNLTLRPTGLWENFFWLQFQNQYLKRQSCIFLFCGLWGHLVLSVVILSAY